MKDLESYAFTDEEIAKCKQAMDKPSPLQTLRAIVDGSVTVEVWPDGRDVYLKTWFGRSPRDPDYPNDPSRKVLLAGAWPLFRAGMIDEDGQPTAMGREMARLVP